MARAHENPDPKPAVGEYRRFREPAPAEEERHRAGATEYFEARERKLELHMLSGSEWGSYQWLGGPGRADSGADSRLVRR